MSVERGKMIIKVINSKLNFENTNTYEFTSIDKISSDNKAWGTGNFTIFGAEIARMMKDCHMEGWIKEDENLYSFSYNYIENPRSLYFLGCYMDIDTGYMLTSFSQGTYGVCLMNFYDEIRLLIPNFNKDSFLAHLEDLKLTNPGTRSVRKVAEILFSEQDLTGITSNYNSSICRGVIGELQGRDKRISSKTDMTSNVDMNTVANYLYYLLVRYTSMKFFFIDKQLKFLHTGLKAFNNTQNYEVLQDDVGLLNIEQYAYNNLKENRNTLKTKEFLANCGMPTVVNDLLSNENKKSLSPENKQLECAKMVREYILGHSYTYYEKCLDNSGGRVADTSTVYNFPTAFKDLKVDKTAKTFYNTRDILACSKNDEESKLYVELSMQTSDVIPSPDSARFEQFCKDNKLDKIFKKSYNKKLLDKDGVVLIKSFVSVDSLDSTGHINRVYCNTIKKVLSLIKK